MPVTVVALLRTVDEAARCLRSLRGTLGDAQLQLGGPAGDRDRIAALAADLPHVWLDGDGAAAWNAAAAGAPGDIVLLDGATEVADGWLEGLAGVAAVDPDVATVTALSNDAAFLSVPRRNRPWPMLAGGLSVESAAARIRAAAPGVAPHVPTALPHATLVTGAAFGLVGPFDETLPDEREALADFCCRAQALGLHHVAAPAVFVGHRGAPPDTDDAAFTWSGAAGARHEALGAAVRDAADDRHSALSRALLSASVALEPLTVTVDARCLRGGLSGTVVHTVELLRGLAERDDLRVRALLPADLGAEAGAALAGVAIERLDAGQADDAPRTHVAHRPWQVDAVDDVALLDRLGERTVLTCQDLIGFRTPGVFASTRDWLDHRRRTTDALGLASIVVFISERSAADAAAEDLVEAQRARVVPLGAGGTAFGRPGARRPEGVPDDGRPFLLVLGNRFRHKNGVFALRLLATLRERYAFDGGLVLAGADVLHGSETADVAAWLLRHPQHADAVHEIGAVNEAGKSWLLEHAAAVLYPSTYEGFGLVPFEAAAAGTPCAYAPVSALAGTLPRAAASLVPWDPEASAERVAAVLQAPDAHVALLRRAAERHTWAATAAGLAEAYRDAVRLPAPRSARLADDLARAQHDYWAIRDVVTEPGWSLVRPDGLLDEGEQAQVANLVRRRAGRTVLRLLSRLGVGVPPSR